MIKSGKIRQLFTKKRVVIATAVVLAVLAVATTLLYVFYRDSPAKVPEASSTENKGIVIEKPSNLSSQLDSAKTDAEKIKLYEKLIASQQLDNDLKGAIVTGIQYAEFAKTGSAYGQLAGLYELQGDNDNAIINYKKAIELSPKASDDNSASPYVYYSQKLTSLEQN